MKKFREIVFCGIISCAALAAQITPFPGPTGGGGGAGGQLSISSATYANGTFYLAPGGGRASATEAAVSGLAPVAGTVGYFTASLSVAPGAGASLAFTWRKNGADQALTCTISGASATTCTDVTQAHGFAVVASDVIDIKMVSAGSPAATAITALWSLPGTAGPAGAAGATGATGAAGATGATGATGPTGPTGPAGAGGGTAYGVDTGSANAYVVNTGGTFLGTDGQQVCFKPANGNTAASTLNADGIGAISIKSMTGSNLNLGSIQANRPACVQYNGTTGNFYLQDSAVANSAFIAAGNGLSSDFTVNPPQLLIDTSAVCTKSQTCAPTGAQDLSGAAKVKMRSASSDPATCTVDTGELFFNTTSDTLKQCSAADTWTAVGIATILNNAGSTVVTGPTSLKFQTTGNLGWTLTDLGSGVAGLQPTLLSLADGSSFFVPTAKTSTYQVLSADFTSLKTITVASGTFTITLVASGSQPASGQYVNIVNYGSGVVTIARSGQNINGGTSSLTLPAGSATAPTSVRIISDGTNYFASGIAGGSSGGGTGTGPLFISSPILDNTSLAPTANSLQCRLFSSPDSHTVTTWVGRIQVSDAGKYFGVALYNTAGNLLTSATSTGTTTASTGAITSAFGGGSLTLSNANAGYYLCLTTNSTATAAFMGEGNAIQYAQQSSNPIMATAANSSSTSGGTITWPATLGALTAIGNDGFWALLQ